MDVNTFLEQAGKQAELKDSIDTGGRSGLGRCQAQSHSVTFDIDTDPVVADLDSNWDLCHMDPDHREIVLAHGALQKQDQDPSLCIHPECHKTMHGNIKRVL